MPSQDIVLGLYYMTRERVNAHGRGHGVRRRRRGAPRLRDARRSTCMRGSRCASARSTSTTDGEQRRDDHARTTPPSAARCCRRSCRRACRSSCINQPLKKKEISRADQRLLPPLRPARRR
ncbi:MAG: hypothetical protein MZW92_51410 [Comamonadaceae bacterium]|nr:hypothetical protein [Comamonadaceae bacterium]